MGLISNITINIYSMVLLIIVYYYIFLHGKKESLKNKLYMMMLQITILMLAVDCLSRFDGKPDTIYPVINHLGNFLIFLLNPLLPSLWVLYVYFNIFEAGMKERKLIYPLLAVNAINLVLVIGTQFFGWYYYIDSNNIYHRGPLYFLASSFVIGLILAAFILIIKNRKRIKKKHYFSLIFFAIPPSLSIALQIIFYGLSLILNSVVLSLLIVFLNIQNQDIYIDYLTGVNNRKKLDAYLKKKINESKEGKTFSAIMIDLNDFKLINDNFGHDEGDKVLQDFVRLLKKCVRSDDFISRYGGDEFCIVLDTGKKRDLEEIVSRIHESVKHYNRIGNKPYKIGFSMGYTIYDHSSDMKVEEFQKLIDVLLYKNKQMKKSNLMA